MQKFEIQFIANQKANLNAWKLSFSGCFTWKFSKVICKTNLLK